VHFGVPLVRYARTGSVKCGVAGERSGPDPRNAEVATPTRRTRSARRRGSDPTRRTGSAIPGRLADLAPVPSLAKLAERPISPGCGTETVARPWEAASGSRQSPQGSGSCLSSQQLPQAAVGLPSDAEISSSKSSRSGTADAALSAALSAAAGPRGIARIHLRKRRNQRPAACGGNASHPCRLQCCQAGQSRLSHGAHRRGPAGAWPAGPRHITQAIAAVQHEGLRNPEAARAFAGTGKYRLADDTDAICTPHRQSLLAGGHRAD
jgi:hypothetical protein